MLYFTLAADAKTYAQYLADTGKNEHPSAEWVAAHPMSPEWENLAAIDGVCATTTQIARNMQGWIAEKNVFQGLPSATGDNTVGHYTQMIWKSTIQVGCTTATANNYNVLVCRYPLQETSMDRIRIRKGSFLSRKLLAINPYQSQIEFLRTIWTML